MNIWLGIELQVTQEKHTQELLIDSAKANQYSGDWGN